MDQLDIAIHSTAHNASGGLPALARMLGMHEQVLRNKVCATTESHKLNLREALAIMDATNDDQILVELARLRGYTIERNVLPNASSIVAAVLNADAEQGDISRAIQQAIADGKLTETDKHNINKEICEAEQALGVLKSTIHSAPTHIGKQA